MKKLGCVFAMVSMMLASNDISVAFDDAAIKGFAASPNSGKIDLSVGMLYVNSVTPYIHYSYYGEHGAGIECQSTFGEDLSFLGGIYYIWNDITSGVDYNKYLFSIQKIKTSSGLKFPNAVDGLSIYIANSMDIIISKNLFISNRLYIDSNIDDDFPTVNDMNFGSRAIYNVNSLMSVGFQFDYLLTDEMNSTYLTPIAGYSLLNNQSFGYLKFDKVNIFGSYSLNLTTDSAKKENVLGLGFSLFFK